MMEWYEATEKYHVRTFPSEGDLSLLPEAWQRELAALWRLEADVNNGGYLQFLGNWDRTAYVYASESLKKIGANRMADIIDRCQALVDEHFPMEGKSLEEIRQLMPNAVINCDGVLIKDVGSALPEPILARISELSYEFMAYPDDVAALGMVYYRPFLEQDSA
jgi:Domain of unknown function (DUF4375)